MVHNNYLYLYYGIIECDGNVEQLLSFTRAKLLSNYTFC